MNTKEITKFLKKNGPTILTAIGIVGTVATTYFGIKSGMKIANITKDDEFDKKDVVKAALPAVITCAASVACAVSGDMLGKKQRNELLTFAALAGSSYSGYRREIIKRYGEEVDKEIIDTVVKNRNEMKMRPDMPDTLKHWVIDLNCEGLPTFEIDAYERDIINAEYHFNRNYYLTMEQNTLDLIHLLGIKPTLQEMEKLSKYGWMLDDGELYHVDFEPPEELADGSFLMKPTCPPWYDYKNLNMYGKEFGGDNEIAPFGDATY